MKTFCVTNLATGKEVNIMAESPLDALLMVALQEVYGNLDLLEYHEKFDEIKGDVVVDGDTLSYGDWEVLKGA